MAFKPLTPATLNITVTKGNGQEWQTGVINGLDGNPVDFSSWDTMQAAAVPAVSGPNAADVSFGTVTGTNAGIVSLVAAAADFATSDPGTARLVISGKVTSGDALQLVASGVLTLVAG